MNESDNSNRKLSSDYFFSSTDRLFNEEEYNLDLKWFCADLLYICLHQKSFWHEKYIIRTEFHMLGYKSL